MSFIICCVIWVRSTFKHKGRLVKGTFPQRNIVNIFQFSLYYFEFSPYFEPSCISFYRPAAINNHLAVRIQAKGLLKQRIMTVWTSYRKDRRGHFVWLLLERHYTGMNIAPKFGFHRFNGVYITRKYRQMELLGPANSKSWDVESLKDNTIEVFYWFVDVGNLKILHSFCMRIDFICLYY
jgi:hypothetical protein